MIKRIIISLFLLIIMLAGCSRGEDEEVIVNKESLEDIEEIMINFSSTDVLISPSETNEIEANLTVYDDGPGAILEKSTKQLTIEMDNDITRLFNLSKKPTLEVKVPKQFKQKIILDGSSGNITGKELMNNDIEIASSSGNVKLHFIELNNDVKITTTSGKVSVDFDEEKPNLELDITTNSGRQSIDLTLYDNSKTKKNLHGISGNGDHKMKIATNSGNIDLN
ncbi:DUF4097 domain-containing protein [Sporosarcina aquimarina]|uniref:DUF4097 family beta strand repeat-containing protein n=1 Tax=Sporosarcina aquimarina TaxID=114975 RepID=UPI0020416610|nr:DUF4097 family beta strand repeat-containing protein [Sporosarcina aquimarina]MCM3758681.1 DUF4097 domain-containing protein [Sporosarcina aquimarina]